MSQRLVTSGDVVDEHTIRVESALKGISGKVNLTVEVPVPGNDDTQQDDDFEGYFMTRNVDLSGFRFDREKANER